MFVNSDLNIIRTALAQKRPLLLKESSNDELSALKRNSAVEIVNIIDLILQGIENSSFNSSKDIYVYLVDRLEPTSTVSVSAHVSIINILKCDKESQSNVVH